MDRDLKILVDTADKLVIQSPPEHMGAANWITLLLTIGITVFMAYKLWSASRIASIGVVVLALVIGVFVAGDRGTGYQMEMDRGADKLTMTSYRGADAQDVMNTSTLPLDSVERADMEFNRASRRITLTVRGQQPVHPLGPDYEHMDSQFTALGRVQAFLGQPQTPGAPAHP